MELVLQTQFDLIEHKKKRFKVSCLNKNAQIQDSLNFSKLLSNQSEWVIQSFFNIIPL